jgi:Peptidase family M23
MRSVRLLACLAAFCLMTARAAHSQDVLTPVIASPLVAQTYAVQGTDNKQHVVYELVITNSGTATATLQKIEVVSGDASHKVLATFEGDALLSRLRTVGREPDVTSAQIAFNGTRLFLVDFTMDKDSRAPAILLHRFHLLAVGPPGPPLSGKGWLAVNGCCAARGVHRGSGLSVNGQMHYAQRFAIDWLLLNSEAQLFLGDGKNVKDYAGYGAKVIAVADGTVVDTFSKLDGQIPGNLPDPKTMTLENVDGNHIVIDLGQGRYAFYAHLQKDSLLVAKGDHVKRGQVLALLGNTGNTSGPHLHFHLMDGVSVLGSSGLPYVIDRFELAGQLSSKQLDASGLGGEWSKDLSAHPSDRRLEFPLDLTVIDF